LTTIICNVQFEVLVVRLCYIQVILSYLHVLAWTMDNGHDMILAYYELKDISGTDR